MCSVDPDEITEMVRDANTLSIDCENCTCRKCGANEVEVILRLKEPYCRTCYLTYFVHKFRSAIGKSKQIKAGDKVLVGVSGGLSSTAIVHLIQQGISDESVKKLRFFPTFLHINEQVLLNEDNKNTDMDFIFDYIVNNDFKCYLTNIESIMNTEDLDVQLYEKEKEDVNLENDAAEGNRLRLKNLIASCSSDSSREDLIYRLRLQLICNVAEKLGFEKIFLADNASMIAVRILSDIAQGRGSHLSTDVHFKTIRGCVQVYRPLREALEEEVEHYNRIYHIPFISSKTNFNQSGIKLCTKKFVYDLQKDFPATIPTIFRTGDKLIAGNIADELSNTISTNCQLCGNIIDTNKKEASALYATLVSEKLSKLSRFKKNTEETVNGTSSNQCLTPNNDASCNGGCTCSSTARQDLTYSDLEISMCYACRIVLKEMKSANHLPKNILNSCEVQCRRAKMKEEIREFLLD